eukprot:TRINITY_DN113221_c0_g1_i1.p1 TRINITY_DN113221_c0_g1~~TRINITY_DN113221_c0_g1_i1.p1  ORF type:complete len:407 (+),score=44.92 TRINITY_DN113221_c0_g1_i1:153-1373(+)
MISGPVAAHASPVGSSPQGLTASTNAGSFTKLQGVSNGHSHHLPGLPPVGSPSHNGATSSTAPAMYAMGPPAGLASPTSLAEQQRMQLLRGVAPSVRGPGSTVSYQRDVACQDNQCAEEECDPEECGDETRPPRDDNFLCGIDRRPLLPVLLVISTVCGALNMMMLQFPLIKEISPTMYGVRTGFLMLYAVTLGTMAYAALSDPGQLSREEHLVALGMKNQADAPKELPIPKRCQKTWLYKLPIRRYDHYCRWLTNAIGLLNHREFVVMMIGIVLIGAFGAVVDIFLVIAEVHRGAAWVTEVFLFAHLGYSITLVALGGPILHMHCGFISRNELAKEWTRNDFYIIHSSRSGRPVPVTDLSDDEFNDRFDSFQYDGSRNDFDQGTVANCYSFWCVPRWKRGELGEF